MKISRTKDWLTLFWRWTQTLWQPVWITAPELILLCGIEGWFGRWIPLAACPLNIGLLTLSWYWWSRNHDEPSYRRKITESYDSGWYTVGTSSKGPS